MSKRNADTVARHVSELERATKGGVTPDIGTAKWANELTGRIRERLAAWRLVGSEPKHATGDATCMVGAFFKSHIDSRTDFKSTTRALRRINALDRE